MNITLLHVNFIVFSRADQLFKKCTLDLFICSMKMSNNNKQTKTFKFKNYINTNNTIASIVYYVVFISHIIKYQYTRKNKFHFYDFLG